MSSVCISKPVHYSLLAWLPALWLLLGSCSNNNTSYTKAGAASGGGYVRLAIAYKTDSSKVIDSIPVTGKKNTVKEIMEAAVQQKKLVYETKAGQHGMIDAIDGLHTNGTKQYWWLCINDTCAAAGFEDQQATPGSTITWHYVTDGKQPCKFCSYNN